MSKIWAAKLTKDAISNVPLPVIVDAKTVTARERKGGNLIVSLVPNRGIGHESNNNSDGDGDNNSKGQENLVGWLHRPNDPDQRSGATGVARETRASSPGSLHLACRTASSLFSTLKPIVSCRSLLFAWRQFAFFLQEASSQASRPMWSVTL